MIAELHGAEITSERIEETQLIPLGTADAVVADRGTHQRTRSIVVTTTVSSAAPVARPRRNLLPGLGRASVLYLLALILVIFGLWIPDTFLSQATFKIVLGDQVVIGILGLAVLVPLSAGAFDLSCGAMLAFSLVIMSWFQAETGLHPLLSAVIALAACGGVGFLSGMLVVKFHVNSFIATLGMSQVLAAATLWISENRQIVGVFSEGFLDFGRRQLFGLPIVVYYLVAIALVIWYVLECTPLGRHLLATGANPEAARLAGVRTDRMVWGSLVVSATVAGLAGIVYGAKVGSFSNTFGPPLLFPAFAAVFFGSTQFKNRAERVGHDRRRLHAGVRRQGPAARLQRWRLLDHAAVQRTGPARSPSPSPVARRSRGCVRRPSPTPKPKRPRHRTSGRDRRTISTNQPRSMIGSPGGNP